jgi:two-component system, NarL family, response regulator LiaR
MDKIKILLAEDHTVVREGFKELIDNEKDMTVIGEAENGLEALRLADSLNPDLIIMDISMPVMNGIEATKKIKELYPSINILILTAYDNEEFIFAIIEAKAAGYMLKNVKGKELLNSIRAVHAGDSVLHPSVTKKILNHLQSDTHIKHEKDLIKLSSRELEVVQLGAKGHINKEIADRLNLSDRTIQTHWRNIFAKLGVSSRIEAIMYCLKNEWINPEE